MRVPCMIGRRAPSPPIPRLLGACLGLMLAGVVLPAGCSKGKANPELGQASQKQPAPVAVATVVRKSVPVEIRSFGNVEPYSTVSIKAQVGGPLTGVYFREGQTVEANALLLTIDPRSYEAAVKQATANLARDTVQKKHAETELRRTEALLKKGAVTQEEYEQGLSTLDVLEAAVQADNAVLDNAKLQLEYCTVRAPITGRTGSHLINLGNLIKANDLPIVVINQVQPVYVSFTVPQQDLGDIRRYFQEANKLEVQARLPKDPEHPARGLLSFIDNQVDTATGTVRLKATFPNKDERLWPGQFVEVVLALTTQSDAVVVPSQAVQTGRQGQYVFIVKDDLTVEQRVVAVGRSLDGETVIDQGLQPGLKVVTDGQLRLVDGSKVDIKGAPGTGPQTRPATGPETRP